MTTLAEATKRLDEIEVAYQSIGKSGMFVLMYVIAPLRSRLLIGETSQELIQEIMRLK